MHASKLHRLKTQAACAITVTNAAVSEFKLPRDAEIRITSA
jgi:hypothetical protein